MGLDSVFFPVKGREGLESLECRSLLCFLISLSMCFLTGPDVLFFQTPLNFRVSSNIASSLYIGSPSPGELYKNNQGRTTNLLNFVMLK